MKRSTKIRIVCQGAPDAVLPCRAAVVAPDPGLHRRIIRRHRRQIGSPWRKLNSGQQALLVLAYLRKGETFAELATGFGVGTATAWRYVTETVALLGCALVARRLLRKAAARLATAGLRPPPSACVRPTRAHGRRVPGQQHCCGSDSVLAS
jgi:hypothetical protein